MIADLHCHYPMHLVRDELGPHGHLMTWWERIKAELEQGAFDLATHLADHPWGKDWKVNVGSLNSGGVGVVCSVLYWPPSEFLPGKHHSPRPGSFSDLMRQLDDVEGHLKDVDHVIVKRAAHLADERIRFVHCIEGGFHLGPDSGATMHENVGKLAERGVFYITLAHLFFRGIATNAAAFPHVSDELFESVCHQPNEGLTPLGEDAVKAMVAHKVVIDVSHMNQDALNATFALLAKEDPKRTLPVIASHVGARSANPNGQHYNLTEDTMRKIKERGGVIGLILSQHQIGETADCQASRAALQRHINAIHDALGSHEYTAFGSDMDGFVNPMLAGFEHASDMKLLEQWIREDFPEAAEDILHRNAERVLCRVFALREGA